jgi:glutathione S-transferase
MEPIQIYHLAPVSRSTRVTWLLAELDPKIQKQFEIKTYDIKKPQEFRNSDEFQKISPLRRFPALVDGKFILTEGIAINNYILRTKAPESSLLPKDLKDLAIYESVNTFMVAHIDGLVAQGLRERFLLPKDQRTPGLLSSLKGEFNRDVVPFLSRRLSTTKYIASDHFTAADINLGTILLLARGLGWVDEHKELAQYFDLLLTSRPEFAKLVSKFMKTSL